jgi:hypothetical protein
MVHTFFRRHFQLVCYRNIFQEQRNQYAYRKQLHYLVEGNKVDRPYRKIPLIGATSIISNKDVLNKLLHIFLSLINCEFIELLKHF